MDLAFCWFMSAPPRLMDCIVTAVTMITNNLTDLTVPREIHEQTTKQSTFLISPLKLSYIDYHSQLYLVCSLELETE